MLQKLKTAMNFSTIGFTACWCFWFLLICTSVNSSAGVAARCRVATAIALSIIFILSRSSVFFPYLPLSLSFSHCHFLSLSNFLEFYAQPKINTASQFKVVYKYMQQQKRMSQHQTVRHKSHTLPIHSNQCLSALVFVYECTLYECMCLVISIFF